MPKPNCIELPDQEPIPILYEDRAVMAIDKPAGWMLVPLSWQRTYRNLPAAILSSLGAGDFWARSRGLKFLRHIHRLDGDTSGILLLAKSLGALNTFSDLFESRKMEKVYLGVVHKRPPKPEWTCRASLAPNPKRIGQMRVDPKGKPAETRFRVVASNEKAWLIEARPYTGRTHQIRVHLAEWGCPIAGDELYGKAAATPMALRAVGLCYPDPFLRKVTAIRAPVDAFLTAHGFAADHYRVRFETLPAKGPPKSVPRS